MDYKKREYHGFSNTKIYKVWADMINRCENKNVKSYKNYGARGIKVCKEWRESFLAFYNYMGNPINKNDTLDRIDVNGNYEPGNCRWTDRVTQSRNQRIPKTNTSGYKGVYRCGKKWVAQIRFNKKTRHLGVFETIEEAIQARKDAEEKYWK